MKNQYLKNNYDEEFIWTKELKQALQFLGYFALMLDTFMGIIVFIRLFLDWLCL